MLYSAMIPNAFAMELRRIITAKMGQRYLIIMLKTFFLRKLPLSSRTSSSIFPTPTIRVINRQVVKAAIGIMTEFVIKSKKSRNCMPVILILARGP